MRVELLPCPFCGNTRPSFERTGTPRQSCIVVCGSCGCRHESSDEGSDSGRSWNDRAPQAAPELSTASRPEAAEALREFVAITLLPYGSVGTRDVDIARWHRAHSAAISALAARAAPGLDLTDGEAQ